jgi:glycosyltransferase involved in cell wall biosynthesis
MKIGFVYEPFDASSGSCGGHGYFLARELSRRGHELIGPNLPAGPGWTPVANTRWGKLAMLRRADVLYIRPGVLHWHERCTWLRLLRPSLPVVWEINGVSEELFGRGLADGEALRRCEKDVRAKRWMAPLVDAAVCVAESLAAYAERRYGIRRTVVAPNGGDPSDAEAARGTTVLSTMPERFKVVWAGGADQPWQGLDQLIAAARMCEAAQPDVLFVLLLGGKAPAFEIPDLRNVLALRGADRLTVARYLADADCAAVLYRRVDPAGVPSWCRGFDPYETRSPLKLFEAMAAGKPVIATAVGQTCEVVRDGRQGLLIDREPTSLVDAIVRLRDDAALREGLGRAARERIASAYTWRHTVDRIEPLLFEVAGRRGAIRADAPHVDSGRVAVPAGGRA